MRATTAFVLMAFLTGCLSNRYSLPGDELHRLASLPIEERSSRVRVIQELGGSEEVRAQDGYRQARVAATAPVSTVATTTVVFVDVDQDSSGERGARATRLT